jgi:hypothetical protein
VQPARNQGVVGVQVFPAHALICPHRRGDLLKLTGYDIPSPSTSCGAHVPRSTPLRETCSSIHTCRLVELPLAPVLPAHLRRIWRTSRRCASSGGPDTLLGAFGVSVMFHFVGLWGTVFGSVGAFFVLMGVGGVLERVWWRTTGTRMRSFWGWGWIMFSCLGCD